MVPLLTHPRLGAGGPRVVAAVVGILIACGRGTAAAAAAAGASRAGAPARPPVDAAQVQQIIEMGFPQAAAELALRRARSPRSIGLLAKAAAPVGPGWPLLWLHLPLLPLRPGAALGASRRRAAMVPACGVQQLAACLSVSARQQEGPAAEHRWVRIPYPTLKLQAAAHAQVGSHGPSTVELAIDWLTSHPAEVEAAAAPAAAAPGGAGEGAEDASAEDRQLAAVLQPGAGEPEPVQAPDKAPAGDAQARARPPCPYQSCTLCRGAQLPWPVQAPRAGAARRCKAVQGAGALEHCCRTPLPGLWRLNRAVPALVLGRVALRCALRLSVQLAAPRAGARRGAARDDGAAGARAAGGHRRWHRRAAARRRLPHGRAPGGPGAPPPAPRGATQMSVLRRAPWRPASCCRCPALCEEEHKGFGPYTFAPSLYARLPHLHDRALALLARLCRRRRV